MATIELDNEELHLVREALHAFRDDFGHDEIEIVRKVKELLAKLPAEPTEPAPAA